MAPMRGATGDWEVVIGMEAHAQVACNAKLFSGAATAFGAEPNAQVSLVDAAMPGMLPVLNRQAVIQAVRTGLGLNAEINPFNVFDRKNYFYPDLPQGYQISQFSDPIVGKGEIELDLEDGSTRKVGIARLHLEQDAGKSIHDMSPTESYIDLNRAGVPLMEVVSEPDMRSPDEAAAYMTKLRAILRYLGACDGNMQEGSLRADVNVSVRRPGAEFGVRCEIKNLNSIRFIKQAAEAEARRQIAILEDGGTIDQETRLYDADKGETRPMRSKEEAHDYRYFPDPDLLPVEIAPALVEKLKSELPELPDRKKHRFVTEFGLSPADAATLVADKESAAYFEAALGGGKRDPKTCANWVTSELFGALNKAGKEIRESPVTAERLGGLIDLIADGTISGRIAKQVFEEMLETGGDAAAIVRENGLKQVTDTGAIEADVDKVIAANRDKVEEYRGGKHKLFGFFVGQVMQATQGKANPRIVNDLLRGKLDR